MQQLTRQLQLRFDERLAERTRIAQEIHDTLLQGFLSASMQVYVAAEALPEGSKAGQILSRALQLMRQVIDEGRNTVRGLRSSRSASLDLESALAQVQQELAQDNKAQGAIGFRIVVDGQPRPLHSLLRDDVYRIGREALTNAIRHARARKIEVELTYSERQLRVQVRDDGCGIDPHILHAGRDGHWGLSGMRERADQIGARLRVYSRVGAGTEVDLCVPGHIAFEGHAPRGLRLRWFGKRNRPQTRAQESSMEKGLSARI
jgi:signal transduction histidine kinase